MTYEGVLTKMETEFADPIQYYLVFENSFLNLNQLLNKELEITFQGYQCLNCGKKKKIFRITMLLTEHLGIFPICTLGIFNNNKTCTFLHNPNNGLY